VNIGYGRGEISPLHGVVVSEAGPSDDPADATVLYDRYDWFEEVSIGAFGDQTVPTAVRRREDSVTYFFHVERGAGVYLFSVGVGTGEGEPCPETYDSITRRVAESFEFAA
jgi:hypothetical protein